MVRNIANIVPPYEKDGKHHGASAALEFAICYLGIEELVILGHSSCGGVQAKLSKEPLEQDDFISSWIAQLSVDASKYTDCDLYAKDSLLASYQNCLTFPWIKERMDKGAFNIHLWFFDIEHAKIMAYNDKKDSFLPL